MLSKKLLILYVLVSTFAINAVFGAPPAGLGNFGNTCYLNATIQNLYNCAPLTNLLLSLNNIYPENTFAHAYVELIREMQSVSAPNAFPILYDNKGQAPNKKLENFVQHAYAFWQTCGAINPAGQMDATEFISTVLSKLMEEDPHFQAPKYQDPNMLRKEHPLGDLLRIGQASIVRCPPSSFEKIKEQVPPEAKKVVKPYERTRIDNELFINVEIDNFTTLKACLDNYFKTEELNNPSDYYQLNLNPNEMTNRPNLVPYDGKKLPDCTRRLAISELNDIVIITLKRFEVIDPVLGTTRKLGQDIAVDQVMNFGSYMANPALKNTSPNYDLVGAIVHAGETLRSGHYIAYVKSDNQWYVCDDTVVMPITWDAMIHPPKELKRQDRMVYLQGRGIYKSYAFFYQKAGTPSQIIAPPIQKEQKGESRKEEALPPQPKSEDLIKALTKLQVALDGLYATFIK